MGMLSRLFISVPTAYRPFSDRKPGYFYVHYLLDPASQRTTLTYEAFSCLNGN